MRMSQEEFDKLQADIDARTQRRQNKQKQAPLVRSLPGQGKDTNSKYRNVRTQYKGVSYHSKAEAEYAADLDAQLKHGQILDWERQPKFLLMPVNPIARLALTREVFTYIADFLITQLDGSRIVVDVKGYEKKQDKTTRQLWASFGPYPLHIVYSKRIVVIPAAIGDEDDEAEHA